MTDSRDVVSRIFALSGDEQPADRLANVLSNFSGQSPEDCLPDAYIILMTDLMQIEEPPTARERAERIQSATREIGRALGSMSWQERQALGFGFNTSPHRPPLASLRKDGPPSSPRDPIHQFIRALSDGAAHAIEAASHAASKAPAHSANADRRNRAIAIRIADIYVAVKCREPPMSGADGPFQRLLRAVYEALAIDVDDLRGPMLSVHEFRKNRKVVS